MTTQIVERGGDADLEPPSQTITIINNINDRDAQVRVTYSDQAEIPILVTVNVPVQAEENREYAAPYNRVVVNVQLPDTFDHGIDNPARIMFRYP